MSAALGVAQLERIEDLVDKRAAVARMYTERLRTIPGVRAPFVVPSTTRMSWFVYVIRLPEAVDRDQVMRSLAKRGVPSRPYFTPIHLQPFYRQKFGYHEGAFPVTEKVARSVLALPFYGAMDEDLVEHVCASLADVLRDV